MISKGPGNEMGFVPFEAYSLCLTISTIDDGLNSCAADFYATKRGLYPSKLSPSAQSVMRTSLLGSMAEWYSDASGHGYGTWKGDAE
jgi:hypothetical protein